MDYEANNEQKPLLADTQDRTLYGEAGGINAASSNVDAVEAVPDVATVSPGENNEGASSLTQIFKEASWRKRLTLITAALVNFAAMCALSIMAPFLPLEAEAKGVNSTTVGIIFASFQFINIIGSIIFGRYLTAIGPRFVYIAGIMIGGCCSVLFGVLEWCPPGTTFTIMAISCRSVEAIGCSMCQTAASAIVANEFPDRIATILGTLEALAGLGLMLGPTIGGALYDLGGFFLPFVAVGVFFFLTGIIACFTLPSSAPVSPKNRDELFKKFIIIPDVLVCGVNCICAAAIITFLDPILSKQLATIDPSLEKSQTLVGLIFLVMPALYAILSPFVGYLADTFKHQMPLMMIGNLSFAIGFLLVGPCPLLTFLPPKQLWLTIVALVVIGLFISFCFMPAFAIITKASIDKGIPNDLDLFGLISGFFGFAFNLGAFLGPLLGGFLVQQLNFEWATAAIAIVPVAVLLLLVVFYVVSKTRAQTTMPEI